MQAPSSDEQLLLKRLFEQDRTAFWQAWMLHQDELYHRCLTWMDGNVTDAQDALSQAALKAQNKLFLHADKITNLNAWLIRFTHNLCMDIHRKRAKEAIGVDRIEEIALQTTVSSNTPELSLLSKEMEIAIRYAIEALSLRIKLPFTMRFEQDMSYLDIAQKLGISLNCVYKRISEARAILQPQMNQYLSGEGDFAFLEISLLSINKEKPTEANLNKGIQQDLSPTLLTQSETGDKALHNEGLQCLYCQSIHISKNGKRRGKQNYFCQECDRQFVDSLSAKGYPLEVRERCLKLYADGMGYRAIGRETGVSPKTVINWVRQEATS